MAHVTKTSWKQGPNDPVGEEGEYLYNTIMPLITELQDDLNTKLTRSDLSEILESLTKKSDCNEVAENINKLSSRIDSKVSISHLNTELEEVSAKYARKDIVLKVLNEAIDKFKNYPTKEELFQLSEQLVSLNRFNDLLQGVTDLSNEVNRIRLQPQEVTIATADVKTLNASPVYPLIAPGSGKYILVEEVECFMEYNSTAYVVGATYDLSVEYETAGQILQFETTGFLDQTSNQTRVKKNNSSVVGVNERLVIKILNGELTTGDSDLKAKIHYKVRDAMS
jgi:hypothetical protein